MSRIAEAGRVVSVNVGLPREVTWRGAPVTTGIFKDPVAGPVRIAGVNLDGDGQADLTVHGGPDKAVYAYPAEHYPAWRTDLGHELTWGAFGENLTLSGLPHEEAMCLGDRLRVGSAELVVTQPRLPCFKLGIRFGDPAMVRRFLASGRSGYYLRIAVEGDVAAGDEVEILARHPADLPVSEITRLFARDRHDVEAARRVLGIDALPDEWRPFFEQLLQRG
jgi:MOSC domain-containing protein YiiM